jgi:hypothetical protein
LQAIFAATDRPYPDAIREHRIKGLNGILADVILPDKLCRYPSGGYTSSETSARICGACGLLLAGNH